MKITEIDPEELRLSDAEIIVCASATVLDYTDRIDPRLTFEQSKVALENIGSILSKSKEIIDTMLLQKEKPTKH